ncbi:MAG: DUF4360 domain-containing protein, partial [Proteobacteria bacterium]|nr:DUF4360 domain-containing protein [Pseudomonadota bacterium]
MGMINKTTFGQNQVSNVLNSMKTALTLLFAASAAMAQADINPIPSNEIFDLEAAVIAGNGCSTETAGLSVFESEDGIRLSLSMSDFLASIHEGQLAVRKSCLARVPVQIPAGYRLTIIEGGADLYRSSGYSFKGTAGLTHTLSGQTTRVDRTDLSNPESDLITLRNPRSVSSEC